MQADSAVTNWRRLTGLGCLSACLWLAACGKAPQAPAADTQVLAIQAGAATAGADALPAQIQARYSSDLSFRVSGKLVERKVHVGDLVRKGQILARLDDADATAQRDAARAGAQAAAHRQLYAGQQLQRDQAQMAQDLIAKAQLEQTQDSYAAARAGQKQAADQLQQAENNLGYHVLRAEHDGLITAENSETGATLAAGQPVYSLAWLPEIDVWVDVGNQQLGSWKRGQKVRLQATELPGVPFDAEVREIAGHEDSQSGSYRIKLGIAHPDARLRPGMTATVMPAASQNIDQSLRIPVEALFHKAEKPAVWVIQPGSSRLQLREVGIASYQASQIIVNRGLRAGEWVVAAGVHNVHEGEKVKPALAPENVFDSARARTQP